MLQGLGCGCGTTTMMGLGALAAAAFDYKGVDCPTLGARIDRLKANMAANPKRAADQKYKTNLTNFTGEYNNRCGGSVTTDLSTTVAGSGVNPFTSAYQNPPGLDPNLVNPLAATLMSQLNPNAQFAMSEQQRQALLEAQGLGTPFYNQTWFKVAAFVAAGALAVGIFKIARRKRA